MDEQELQRRLKELERWHVKIKEYLPVKYLYLQKQQHEIISLDESGKGIPLAAEGRRLVYFPISESVAPLWEVIASDGGNWSVYIRVVAITIVHWAGFCRREAVSKLKLNVSVQPLEAIEWHFILVGNDRTDEKATQVEQAVCFLMSDADNNTDTLVDGLTIYDINL